MKPITSLSAMALFSLALVSCDPPAPANNAAAEEARLKLEQSQAAYEQQAADMQARSADLQQQLADLQRSIQEKENAELQAKLEAIQRENEKLMADAEAARLKSEELRDQLAATPAPSPAPYYPPAPTPGGQAWVDPEADYSMFYEELTPHGNWLDVEGYGYAWQPTLASRSSWRPYVDGRWVWSDQGWAWDTPEPFGWACYHYGRWVRIARHGWVWVPGREWAPAWVSWRSGADCVGWAPLPPERRRGYTSIGYDCDVNYGLSPSSYVFIQSSNFGRNSYVNVCLSITNITNIFQQTVNLTNIVRINQQQTNFFVHRGGPDRRWLEGRFGGRVPVAPVRIVPTLERPVMDRGDRDRDSVRPLIAAPLPSGRPGRPSKLPRIADKIARPAIVDAWTDVPDDRRQKLRDTISRQAREPKPVLPAVVTQPPQVPDQGPGPRPLPGERPEVRPGLPLPGGVTTPPDRMTDRGRDRGDRPQPGERPEVRPGLPLPGGVTTPPDRMTDRSREREDRPGLDSAAAKQAELARRAAEAAGMKQREDAARQNELLKQKEAAEEKMRDAAKGREKAAEAMKEAEANRRQRDASMAQQQELARKQAESSAMQERLQEQQKLREDLRRQQGEAMKAREAQAAQQAEMARRQRDVETSRAREAAMAQQQELARRNQAAAEMQKRQLEAQQAEMMNRQREALAEKAREAAARQQQEMAERQREVLQKQQEAAQREAMRQQQEQSQRRAQEETQRRNDDGNRRRER